MTYRLAVIGTGQVGSRHLQALTQIDLPVSIWAVDPDRAARRIARERAGENRISYHHDLEALPESIDVAIIATNADIRPAVLADLLARTRVRHLILEKVVFQSPAEFDRFEGLQNCTVNCFRRAVPTYQRILERIEPPVRIRVGGTNWGLACNAIHFIDLISFFSGETDYHLETGGLEPRLFEGRRAGFTEVRGTLRAVFAGGHELILEEHAGDALSFPIEITAGNGSVIIDEIGQNLHAEGRLWDRQGSEPYQRVYQSNLTHHIVHDLLTGDHCRLTPFAESARLHKPLLETLTAFIAETGGRQLEHCPIT